MENSIESIIKKTFSNKNYSEKLEKLEIITAGKTKPKSNITTNFKTKKKIGLNTLLVKEIPKPF